MGWLFSLMLIFSCSAQAATLFKMRGDVKVNDEPAQEGQELKVGDKVEAVSRKSFAIVKFEIGSKTLLTNGKLVIKKMQKKDVEIDLIQGIISSHVQKA